MKFYVVYGIVLSVFLVTNIIFVYWLYIRLSYVIISSLHQPHPQHHPTIQDLPMLV